MFSYKDFKLPEKKSVTLLLLISTVVISKLVTFTSFLSLYPQFIYSNEYMSIVTVVIAFWLPISVMIGLYVRVWYETVKRQKELVHLQAGKKASSKRSDSR